MCNGFDVNEQDLKHDCSLLVLDKVKYFGLVTCLYPLFKPSVTQPISQTTYDLNRALLVRYSSHVLNDKLLVHYSTHDLNNEPFNQQTNLDHLNN